MLKDLNDLVVTKIHTFPQESLTEFQLKAKVRNSHERAKELRGQIDPTDLEIELHEHIEKAFIELDHVIDVLAVCALKTKDECEEEIFSQTKASPVIPEFAFNSEYRSLHLYWRRIKKVTPGTAEKVGKLTSSRIPITRNDSKEEEAGFYPKTIFSSAQKELRQTLNETEEQFRRLRTLMQCVSQIRRTIGVIDRHAKKYFDDAIVYETKSRRTSSKPENLPMTKTKNLGDSPDF